MNWLTLSKVQEVVMFIPLFILSLSIHEYAHAWVAQKLGDPTAKYLGRLTIDPMAHISVLGTIIFPLIGLLSGGYLFGWANPVPIDARHFKKPRQGMALVASAGPAINVLMAVFAMFLLGLLMRFIPTDRFMEDSGPWQAFMRMTTMGVQLNLFLAFFNLIPLPPLDGSRILAGLVGERMAQQLDAFERSSGASWLLLILIFSGAFQFLGHYVMAFQILLFRIFV
jgi:Zn-dependent protease